MQTLLTHRLTRLSLFALALAALGGLMPNATPAHASLISTITVNTLADEQTAKDGQCSLREAINNANNGSDTTQGDCRAGGTALTFIQFSVNGMIPLDLCTLVINSVVTIDGGNTIMVNGKNVCEIFEVLSGASLYLKNLTLTNGDAGAVSGGAAYVGNNASLTVDHTTIQFSHASVSGGGIYADSGSTLQVINNSVVDDNKTDNQDGGGIWTAGSALISDSIIGKNNLAGGYGGGVYNQFDLTIRNSTLDTNSASQGGGGVRNYAGTTTLDKVTLQYNSANVGGGVHNSGQLNVYNSTFVVNSAKDAGGGIFNQKVDTFSGIAGLINSTLSGNNANYGGGFANLDTATLFHVTLNGNWATGAGGGIYHQGQVAQSTLLRNTIVANSPKGNNCFVFGVGGTSISSGGYNLSSDNNCTAYFNQTGDLNGVNPNLGPLDNYGGPTLTQILYPPSPAIDAIPVGTNGCGTTIATDQRGVSRPQGGRCDIGAVERTVVLLPLVVR